MDPSAYDPSSRRFFPQPGRDYRPSQQGDLQIVDNGNPIQSRANTWDAKTYSEAVKKTTPWNADNFQGAYDEAARKGQSVTFLVGSKDTRETQALLKNIEEMKAKNPNMQFVYLDRDKINSDPRYKGLQDWVSANTKNDNLAFSAQYGVRPGKDGKPEGGRSVSTHWGGEISGSLMEQSRFGQSFTREHTGNFKFTDNPENANKGDESVKPKEKDRPDTPAEAEAEAEAKAEAEARARIEADLKASKLIVPALKKTMKKAR